MKKLKDSDLKLLTSICQLRQKGLWKTMAKYLKQIYGQVTVTSDYLCAEGDIPIALVAHLDTVFPTPPSDIYYDEKKGVLWSPDGLGADDRAGVFAIIKILRMGFRPHIIFTTDEEKGGLGAARLVLDHTECIFKELKYIIQLDRRGTNDCVFYDCENDDFTEYIENFGFIESIGSFSDISTICPAWKIAGVNLSIGYEDEHSFAETLHVNPLLATINKVICMLKDSNEAEYYKFVPSKWYYRWGMHPGMDDEEYDYDWSYYNYYGGMGAPDKSNLLLTDECVCDVCGKTFSEYEVIPVERENFTLKYVCPDCIDGRTEEWCEACGNCFEKKPGDTEHLCYTCREEIKHMAQKKNKIESKRDKK